MVININEKSIVLIDKSYFIYYRVYATLRWFKFKNVEFEDKSLLHENDEFMLPLKKHILNDINKFIKFAKTYKKNIYFCSDVRTSEIWRNMFINDYKAGRKNFEFDHSFFSILKEFDVNELFGDCLEADDIIAIIHKNVRILSPEHNIVIITNDNDLLQLNDPFTKIVNAQMKDITYRGASTSEEELFYKAVLGDKSDNITPIFKISKTKLKNIYNSENHIEWIKKNNIYDSFQKNMKIINLNMIPDHLVNMFLKKNDIKI